MASFLRDRGFRSGSYGRRWLVSVTLASRLPACTAGTRPVTRAALRGAAGRRYPGPPPTGVWARRYAARGTRFPGRRAYAWGMDKAVSRFAATFVTDTTNPPAPRPRWLRRGRYDLVEVADVIIALICFAVTNSTLTNANASQPRPPRDRPAGAARVRRLRAARAAHAVPARRVGGFRGGPHLDQPGDPAGLARRPGRPGGRRARLRPVPVRGDGPLPAADRGRRGGRHRGRGRVHRPGVDSPGRLPDRGPHPPRRRGPGAAQRRAPARRAGAPALRRARAARGAAAHRPGAARRGRPPHVGDRDPGRGGALQDRRSAAGAGGELR